MSIPVPDEENAPPSRRRYESPLRREQAAQTRHRILTAGADIARSARTWGWDELTFGAVAARAGVGERTVYRHFPTEQHLREAVMRQLEDDAGVHYEELTPGNIHDITARVFRAQTTLARELPDPVLDPAFTAADQRRQDALRRMVVDVAPGMAEGDRERLAALLDVLWSVAAFERLVRVWKLDPDEATAALSTLMSGVLTAIGQQDGAAGDRIR